MRENLSLIELLQCHRTSSPAVLKWFDRMFGQEPAPAQLHEISYEIDVAAKLEDKAARPGLRPGPAHET